MDKKNQTILTVLAALTLLVALLGATFAYFSATSKSEPQIITTSSLSLNVSIKGETHVTNIKPTTWVSTTAAETNEDIAIIPFTVTTPAGVKAVYSINMSAVVPSNISLTGGSASDVKYKLFKSDATNPTKEGSLAADFNEDIIIDAPITEGIALNDAYVLYIYIENKDVVQNTLQDIDISINLIGTADQID